MSRPLKRTVRLTLTDQFTTVEVDATITAAGLRPKEIERVKQRLDEGVRAALEALPYFDPETARVVRA